MNARIFFLCLFAWAAALGNAAAQTPIPELNRVRGVWDFNDTLNSYWACQPPVKLVGTATNYVAESSYKFQRFAMGLTNAQWLEMPTVGGANGPVGASYMNNWTLVMDLRVPLAGTSADPKGYVAILQDEVSTTIDAECFIGPTGALYLATVGNVTPSNTFPRNVWTRLGIRSTYNPTTTKQELQYFINGSPVGSVSSVDREGRFALGGYAFLFTDDNNETAPLDVNSLGFWSQSLSNSSVSAMGGPTTTGLNWSGLPVNTWCPPIPYLTGQLASGTINTTFTAATQMNNPLLQINDPVVAGTVARVLLNLPSQDGKIPGKPRHYFDGLITVDVLPNGDCKLVYDVNVKVLPDPVYGPRDVELVGNVMFERVETIMRGAGILGKTTQIILPIGCQASSTATSRRMRSTLHNSDAYYLDANLVPTATYLSFDGGSVGGNVTNSLYLSFDRLPVRWKTPELRWYPATGQLVFTPDSAFSMHHRDPQIAVMALLNQPRATNDGMFHYALPEGNSVTLSANAGSYTFVNFASLYLTPTKFPDAITAQFDTHFPRDWTIQWTDPNSGVRIVNNQVDGVSHLNGVTSNMGVRYEQGCADGECDGPVPALPKVSRALNFTPAGNSWNFTPDLGLSKTGTPVVASGTMLAWGYSGATIAHRLSPNFTAARALTAGSVLRGQDLTSANGPATLLLSGHTSPTNSVLVERPGTATYDTGAADYPGLNFRVPDATFTARSNLAGNDTAPYALTTNSKYYTRISGVSGKHESAANTNPTFVAFGFPFRLSALRLGFLSGRNVTSGVQGYCEVTTPLDKFFALNFDRLIFGCSGALQGANLSATQPSITLSYWGNLFTPTALDFPQPKTCPPPPGSAGFVRLAGTSTFPALSSQPMSGTLGFANGDLVTESLPSSVINGVVTPVAQGLGAISRFTPNGPVIVSGPAGTGWRVYAQGGVYLDRYDQSGGEAAGTVNLNGLVDVPFFMDLPVHLSTSAAKTATDTTLVYFRNLISTEKYYDPEHRGRPFGIPRDTFYTSGNYDPHATKHWLNLVDFDYPLVQDVSRQFKSRAPITDNALKIMKLQHQVTALSPNMAELNLKGEIDIDPLGKLAEISVGGLLESLNDIFPGVSSSVLSKITKGASATINFDSLLGDDLSANLGSGLNSAASPISSALYTQLSANPVPATLNNVRASLANNIDTLFGSGATGLNGQWRRTLQDKLTQVDTQLVDFQSLINTAGDIIALANSLRTKLGQAPLVSPEISRIEIARNDLTSAMTRIRDAVSTAKTALDGSGALSLALDTALPPTIASAGNPSLENLVQLALNDLQAKWNTQAAAQGSSFFAAHNASELQSDLSQALADRVLGSAFGSQALSLLRMHLADTQYALRQTVDETLGMLKNAAKDAISDVAKGVLGSLGSFSGMGSITGNAHINGDTLNELRVDGKLAISVGGEAVGSTDSLKVNGYFILRDVDSTTPDGACRASFGAASEILVGASGAFSWGSRTPGAGGISTIGLGINGKFTLDAPGNLIGLAGDIAILGDFGFQDVNFKELKFGFGFGAGDAYFYGRASGSFKAMDVTAGAFFGQTCDIGIMKNVDKDIATVLTTTLGSADLSTFPVIGAAVYAEGSMSLMPIIGIPPSCLLDLRVGGGQGVFIFKKGPQLTVGFKQSMSIRGELLCLVDVTGQLAYVIAGSGNLDGTNLQADGFGRATVTGEVGYSPFSWDFEKTLTMRIHAAPVSYKIDY